MDRNTELNEKADEMLRVRVKGTLNQRLNRIADRRGISKSDVAREGIIEHLIREETRLGFMGAA